MAKRSIKSQCHFNPNEYNYLWSTTARKGWGQRKCPTCGLWTVHIHHATGLKASQCEGTETFWATTRAILEMHEQRGSQNTKVGRAKGKV